MSSVNTITRKKSKTSAAVKNRYATKTYDRIIVQVKKGEKERLKHHAQNIGLSLNGFINRAIDESLDDDYCRKLYNDYIADPDKDEPIDIHDVAKKLGITL